MNLFAEEISSNQTQIKTPKEEKGGSKKKVKTFLAEQETVFQYENIDNFFDNQIIFENLSSLFSENKLPHSLILEGETGQNKLDFAYNLAVNCIAKSLNQNKNDIYEKFQKDIMNDILIVKNQNEKQILINEVRQINSFIATKSISGNPKFVIIDSIDYLNINSANCLLKNLEEPSEAVFFILIYNKINQILKTILSRCIKIKLKNYSDESFKTIIENKNLLNDNLNFYQELSSNSVIFYNIFIKNDLFSFYNLFVENIKNKNSVAFYINFTNLYDKIKITESLFYKKIIILKLFSKIFIDIYNKEVILSNKLDKYENYIKFFQKIFDQNLNLIYYYNLI